jgi:hypothetical protein
MMGPHLGECLLCLRVRSVVPVAIFPGVAGVDCLIRFPLCLWCRVAWKSSRYCCLAEEFLHSTSPGAREAAQWTLEWEARKP